MLLDEYATEAALTLQRLGQAIADGAAEEARSLAHRLAGSSATLGARALAAELRAIEAEGREGRTRGDLAEGARLQAILDSTMDRFEQLVRDAAV